MPSESKTKTPPTRLTAARVDQIVREPGDTEFSDLQQPGLYLRQSKRGASWRISVMSNGKRNQFKIGSPPTLGLADARRIAGAGIDRVKAGYDLDLRWLDGQYVALGLRPEPSPVATMSRVRAKTWLYEEGVDAYIASLGDGVRRLGSRRSYRQTLMGPHVRKALVGKSIVDIDRRTVAAIVSEMGRAKKFSGAEQLCTQMRMFWGFLSDDENSKASGVEHNVMIGLKPPKRPEDRPRGSTVRVPGLPGVGLAIAVARSGVLHPTTSLAAEFVVLTLQRRQTIASARVDEMMLDGRRPYWDIAGERMKLRQGHAIPLFGRSLEIVHEAIEISKQSGSEYLFPEIRTGKRTTENPDPGHISLSALSHGMSYSADVSPHRLRHAFTSVINGMEDDEDDDDDDLDAEAVFSRIANRKLMVKLILDHREGRIGSTDLHYDFAQLLKVKARILREWVQAIEKPTADAIDSYDPVAGKSKLQERRRSHQKTPKLSESRRHKNAMAKIRTARETEESASAEDTTIIQRVFEDHRTGHISDEAALHALRLPDIEHLVAHRIVAGHDISERPDLAGVVASALKRWKEVRQAWADREKGLPLPDFEAAE
ncbi:hypothetical protein NS365_05670 [Aureimonas ureilytica]|uniref:Uncharacterized protein n=1 Tax=Aureimonas ureilytica TaxID=401562 RepID=A0A175RT52_9HYPH|nr:integrase family protein [Aureimonas ureilytica]KTR06920.1 hypothetical protein NS365_05670 [Aureimonas ureilytica]